MRWSRTQQFGLGDDAVYTEYANVPGGVIVKTTENGTHTMCFVPDVYVYDAGGQSGPFLRSMDEYDEDGAWT